LVVPLMFVACHWNMLSPQWWSWLLRLVTGDTLTARLAQKYDILSLSTGDLREDRYWPPDEIVVKVVMSKLDALQNKVRRFNEASRFTLANTTSPAALDLRRLPSRSQTRRTSRCASQVCSENKCTRTWLIIIHRKWNMSLTLVVSLDVPDDIILSRISDRRVHIPSGRVYNMSYNCLRVEGFDTEPLTRWPDDNLVSVFLLEWECLSTASPHDRTYSLVASTPTNRRHHC
jgi:hypothetical protein